MTQQKLTKNQELVFDALTEASAPMTAYAILDVLRDDGFRAPLQVYRALEKLVASGLVHRLESINSFVVCAHPHEDCTCHGLTGFAICSSCGKSLEFHPHGIDEQISALLAKKGFRVSQSIFEIRGVCAACQ